MTLRIGDVETFANVRPDKEHALKVLEEAAEVFGAWQRWNLWTGVDLREDMMRGQILDECADTIQAVCNLIAAFDVADFEPYMQRCEQRNRERGRISDGN